MSADQRFPVEESGQFSWSSHLKHSPRMNAIADVPREAVSRQNGRLLRPKEHSPRTDMSNSALHATSSRTRRYSRGSVIDPQASVSYKRTSVSRNRSSGSHQSNPVNLIAPPEETKITHHLLHTTVYALQTQTSFHQARNQVT
jgi:hypothetical protein